MRASLGRQLSPREDRDAKRRGTTNVPARGPQRQWRTGFAAWSASLPESAIFLHGVRCLNDFDIAGIQELYASTPDSEVFNVLCLLDNGLMLNAKVSVDAEGDTLLGPINIRPESKTETAGEINNWLFTPFGTPESRIGSYFGFLYFALAHHLGSCVLKPPNLLQYLDQMFNYDGGRLIT